MQEEGKDEKKEKENCRQLWEKKEDVLQDADYISGGGKVSGLR